MRIKHCILSVCFMLMPVVAGHVHASPDIQSWTTQQGVKVLFVENNNVD